MLTVLLHDRKETDDDLGARADEDLTLATLLGVDNVVKTVGKNCKNGQRSAIVEKSTGLKESAYRRPS